MENTITIYTYLWKRLPLILMFANGYLIYRLFVVTKLTEAFVFWSLQKSRGRLNRICLYIIMISVLLSFFIPNAITVLILLPVLKTIESDIASQTQGVSMSTALTLSAIYGANIGGMGSLIGSPANLLLIGALDLYTVPGREQISFFNWFLWSVPLVAIFSGVAWLLVATYSVPKEAKRLSVRLEGAENHSALSWKQTSGALLFIIFLSFWIAESVLKELIPGFEMVEPPLCICFFAIFIYLAFIRSPGPYRARLLRPKDVFTGLPKRGILFLCLFVALISIVRFFRLDKHASDFLLIIISPDIPLFAIIFLIIITVIFLTELLSNTVVSTAFFPIAYFVSTARDISPLSLMIAVSIASTCAFMTPVATPCNALAFGEMKGTSFRMMLILGFFLNIIGASLMAVWVQFVVSLIYPIQ